MMHAPDTHTPFSPSHMHTRTQAPIAYGSVYEVFLWAWWGGTDEWVYAALNWGRGTSLGAYFALPILVVRWMGPGGGCAGLGARRLAGRLICTPAPCSWCGSRDAGGGIVGVRA